MNKLEKKYPSIGCCGIDCGLCPRHFTEGKSKCPGCFGPNFLDVMGQTCSFISCCVKNKNLVTCGECSNYPCEKFDSQWFGENSYDSFVTHKKAIPNLNLIKKKGFDEFIRLQKKRIKILKIMLKDFNDGRSKSFFCLASALLSIDILEKSLESASNIIDKQKIKKDDIKGKAKILKDIIKSNADKEKISLKLQKPPNWK
ncbi:MAG: hypothetical protein AYK22_06060 [Thermoplasmatales archaeon SG8-52-3]|nr:MAG: hypothetical protein AYK22_06060 [Thermoplasmatales archaeon SG8-52-3]